MGLNGTFERAAALLAAIGLAHASADCAAPSPEVTIPQGSVRGFRDAHCNSVYLGVPFAQTTGGANRWRAPQDLPASGSTFDAVAYGPTCPQAIASDLFTSQDEDCLNLNIWAPAGAENLPVRCIARAPSLADSPRSSSTCTAVPW